MSSCRCVFMVAAAVVASAGCVTTPKPDVENGKTNFIAMCGVCHSVMSKGGGATLGPNLVGIVGRKAGSEPEFSMYTAALKTSSITWSPRTLDTFLVNPDSMVKGTAMPMQIADSKTRADVVAYLATLKK